MHKTSRSKDYLRFPCAAVWSGEFFERRNREGDPNRHHRFAFYHIQDQNESPQGSEEELRGTHEK